jgi:hypothetical protein
LIVKLRQKILVRTIQITEIHQRLGKENLFNKNHRRFFISSSSKTPTSYAGNDNGDAQKRFTNAKAISSDQFFNKDSDVGNFLCVCGRK